MGFREVALGAIGYLNELKQPLAKALVIPFLIYTVLNAAAHIDLNILAFLFATLFSLMVQTVIAVTTHRMILLGPGAVPEWGISRWSMRETFFTLHAVGLVLVVSPLGLLGIVPVVGWLLALIVACWLIGRLSLVFPGIAIDQGVTFGLSWKLTRNRQMLMFLVVVIFPAMLFLPIFLLELLPYTLILTSFLATLATIMTIAALSVAYKIIYKETYETKSIGEK